jgi:hypothetical protein
MSPDRCRMVFAPRLGSLVDVDVTRGTFRTAARPDVVAKRVPQTPSLAWLGDSALVLAGAAAVHERGSITDVDVATWTLDAATLSATRLPVDGSVPLPAGRVVLIGGPARWRVDLARGEATALGPIRWSALDRAGAIRWTRSWPAARNPWDMVYLSADGAGRYAYVGAELGSSQGEVLRIADGKRVGRWRWPDGISVLPSDGVGIRALGL